MGTGTKLIQADWNSTAVVESIGRLFLCGQLHNSCCWALRFSFLLELYRYRDRVGDLRDGNFSRSIRPTL